MFTRASTIWLALAFFSLSAPALAEYDPPYATSLYPLKWSVIGPEGPYSASFKDISGVLKTDYYIDGQLVATGGSSVTYKGALCQIGYHTFRATSYDIHGNWRNEIWTAEVVSGCNSNTDVQEPPQDPDTTPEPPQDPDTKNHPKPEPDNPNEAITLDSKGCPYNSKKIAVVRLSRATTPYTADHWEDVISRRYAGGAWWWIIDRKGATKNRKASLRGIPTKKGYDRDEMPPALSKARAGGGTAKGEGGGADASVRYVPSSDNRSAGSVMGRQLRGCADGARFMVRFQGSYPKSFDRSADFGQIRDRAPGRSF